MYRLLFLSLCASALTGTASYANVNTSDSLPLRGEILTTLKKEHPRLISTGRIDQIKQAIHDEPVAGKIWEKVKSFADQTLTVNPSVYELRDGRRLLYVSKEALDRIRALGLVYRVTGERKYADRAWAELEAVANFKDWNPGHFLDVGEMTHAVAIGYDWLYDQWTPAQRSLLVNAIVEKGMQPGLNKYSASEGFHTRNHNWNQICNGGLAIGALAIADREPEMASEILSNALRSIRLPMEAYAPDGATWEGVSYWDYGSRYNILLLDALESALGTDFGLSETGAFKESGDYQIYISGTNRLAFDFGDCKRSTVSTPQHMWMGRKYKIPRYSWFRYNALATGQRGDVLDLLWFDDTAKSYDINQIPLDRCFRQDDVASMRDTWENGTGFIAAIQGGDNDALSHRHLDLGSFILECDGIRWIVDSGKESQVYQRHRNNVKSRWDFYRLRTEGHNTYVMNLDQTGGNQSLVGDARFVHFDSQPDRAEAILDLSRAYPLAEAFTRKFTLQRGQSFTVSDTVTCTEAVDLRTFFHTTAAIELGQDGRTARLSVNDKTLEVELVKPHDAVFTVVPAEPGPASPQLSFQASNKDCRKLTIHLDNVERAEIEVIFKRSFSKN